MEQTRRIILQPVVTTGQGISRCPHGMGSLSHASIRPQVPTVVSRLDRSRNRKKTAASSLEQLSMQEPGALGGVSSDPSH